MSVSFARLFLILSLSESLSGPLMTGMLATGKIRDYQILVGGLLMLNFPISYVFLKLGASPLVTVIIAIVISHLCLYARLYMLRKRLSFPVREYIYKVYINVIKVTAVAVVVALSFSNFIQDGWLGFVSGVVISIICACLSVLFIGCSTEERRELVYMVRRRLGR
jgi:hypothetical protein